MGLNANSGGRDSSQRPRKMDVWIWQSPWFSMYQCRLVIRPSSLMVNLAHTPSAEIQQGGRVGLSSVPHGKLVAYKSYI